MDVKELQNLLLYQYKKYPQMQVADMFKLLYQSEFGCGHMVSDEIRSFNMICEEAAALAPKSLEDETLEPIGDGLCRLHLRILKQDTLTPDTLNRFFVLTANQPRGSAKGFEEKAAVLKQLCRDRLLPFKTSDVTLTLKEYRAAKYPVTRHSQRYRLAYAPAYRVLDKRFCDFLSLFCRIDDLMRRKNHVVCAIDGNCAAGKTTLASLLRSVYGCNVFSMDEFFLQPSQRTSDRLAELGGNVDYERFGQEVLEPLLTEKPFVYRPYDCSTQKMSKEVFANPHPLNIVEGVYSLHPLLSEAYDLKVFYEIDTKTQNDRLAQRNKELHKRFIKEWIPMENKYFDAFQIPEQCNLIFKA